MWESATINTYFGFKYYLLIMDVFLRKSWVILLKNKFETFRNFTEWKTLIENQANKNVKAFRTDNGLELYNEEFDNFCENNGIFRQRTVIYTPQQNGLVEMMNRTLLENVRYKLISFGLPKLFWGEAIKIASYLISIPQNHWIIIHLLMFGVVILMIIPNWRSFVVLHIHTKMKES